MEENITFKAGSRMKFSIVKSKPEEHTYTRRRRTTREGGDTHSDSVS
jgi:hypothetical protein